MQPGGALGAEGGGHKTVSLWRQQERASFDYSNFQGVVTGKISERLILKLDETDGIGPCNEVLFSLLFLE